jgi:hypothetical protein
MPVIGSTLMWAENPAEWQESGSKMYVNASSSLLIMYTLSVAWCPEKRLQNSKCQQIRLYLPI